jgi:hypothetical protein
MDIRGSDVILQPNSNDHKTDALRNDDGYATNDGSESTPKAYIHTAMDLTQGCCIRLIRLYPGRGDEELVCQIVHVDLDSRPVYEVNPCCPKYI